MHRYWYYQPFRLTVSVATLFYCALYSYQKLATLGKDYSFKNRLYIKNEQMISRHFFKTINKDIIRRNKVYLRRSSSAWKPNPGLFIPLLNHHTSTILNISFHNNSRKTQSYTLVIIILSKKKQLLSWAKMPLIKRGIWDVFFV